MKKVIVLVQIMLAILALSGCSDADVSRLKEAGYSYVSEYFEQKIEGAEERQQEIIAEKEEEIITKKDSFISEVINIIHKGEKYICYDANGGCFQDSSLIKFEWTDKAWFDKSQRIGDVAKLTPVRDNMHFLGWSLTYKGTDIDFYNGASTKKDISNVETLYAIWSSDENALDENHCWEIARKNGYVAIFCSCGCKMDDTNMSFSEFKTVANGKYDEEELVKLFVLCKMRDYAEVGALIQGLSKEIEGRGEGIDSPFMIGHSIVGEIAAANENVVLANNAIMKLVSIHCTGKAIIRANELLESDDIDGIEVANTFLQLASAATGWMDVPIVMQMHYNLFFSLMEQYVELCEQEEIKETGREFLYMHYDKGCDYEQCLWEMSGVSAYSIERAINGTVSAKETGIKKEEIDISIYRIFANWDESGALKEEFSYEQLEEAKLLLLYMRTKFNNEFLELSKGLIDEEEFGDGRYLMMDKIYYTNEGGLSFSEYMTVVSEEEPWYKKLFSSMWN